ncbi:MAG: hypothetical protein GX660_10605 [Clostridiaceae bacterium]|nr:hypothetical protein [Clostridiaceae bacterium]
MILYTVVPHEIIFQNNDTNYSKDSIEIDYLDEKVVVMPVSNNSYRIERLISTSPKSYLNPGLMPGEIININFERLRPK